MHEGKGRPITREVEVEEIKSWPTSPMRPGGHLWLETAVSFERRGAGLLPLKPGERVPDCECERCVGTPLTRMAAKVEAAVMRETRVRARGGA